MANGIFETTQDAFDFMETFAKGDEVNIYQPGGLNHYGTIVRPIVYGESETFGGKYAKIDVKLQRGNNIVTVTSKMMVDGSWILTCVTQDEKVEISDEKLVGMSEAA